jgi:hypothetical protein
MPTVHQQTICTLRVCFRNTNHQHTIYLACNDHGSITRRNCSFRRGSVLLDKRASLCDMSCFYRQMKKVGPPLCRLHPGPDAGPGNLWYTVTGLLRFVRGEGNYKYSLLAMG